MPSSETRVVLPVPNTLKPPSDLKEVEQYVALGEAMLCRALEFNSDLRDRDRKSLRSLLTGLSSKLTSGIK